MRLKTILVFIFSRGISVSLSTQGGQSSVNEQAWSIYNGGGVQYVSSCPVYCKLLDPWCKTRIAHFSLAFCLISMSTVYECFTNICGIIFTRQSQGTQYYRWRTEAQRSQSQKFSLIAWVRSCMSGSRSFQNVKNYLPLNVLKAQVPYMSNIVLSFRHFYTSGLRQTPRKWRICLLIIWERHLSQLSVITWEVVESRRESSRSVSDSSEDILSLTLCSLLYDSLRLGLLL